MASFASLTMRLKIGHSRGDGADFTEHAASLACDQEGQRGLAGSRRAPEDHRGDAVSFDGLSKHPFRVDYVALPDELVERARPHPGGQRSGLAEDLFAVVFE